MANVANANVANANVGKAKLAFANLAWDNIPGVHFCASTPTQSFYHTLRAHKCT